VTDDVSQQIDAFLTPGTLLRQAREEQGIPEREAADRLNLMPNYVGILERDDYAALRSPAFARGYVKAYGKLLGLNEQQLMSSFDQLRESGQIQDGKRKRIETRPLQLQSTGLGVVVGLAVLLLLVVALWWWQGDGAGETVTQDPDMPMSSQNKAPESGAVGDL
jgi:cytoskeletal protein RodZ